METLVNIDDIKKIILSNGNIDTLNLLDSFEIMKKTIEFMKTTLKRNEIVCQNIENYYNQIEKLIEIVKTHHLTNNHISLMNANYKYFISKERLQLNTYICYLEKWEEDNIKLNQDLTQIFSSIITSNAFQELYLTAMESSYVKSFVQKQKLMDEYQNFMKKYAKNLNEYILYIPLAEGIKAYTSNYFRIVLNINSVELIGDFKDEVKKELYISHLLISLLQESFHFLYRLNMKGKPVKECQFPQNKKIKQCYEEIGVDLILHIFGTEYITFISVDNSKLVNNLDSWKNDNTNFNVFDKIYLSDWVLQNDNKTTLTGNGLKFNISMNEDIFEDMRVCTNDAIRYCY